jgi:TetR/AcrR family transcriptional repressor of nem operon
LPRDVNCKDLASFVLTVMEGGVMQSRTHRSIESFDASVRLLRDYMTRLESTASSRARSPRKPQPTKTRSRK